MDLIPGTDALVLAEMRRAAVMVAVPFEDEPKHGDWLAINL